MGLDDMDDSKEGIQSFVAEDKDCIIGVILSGHDGRRGYIYHMVVVLSMRKRGIGKLLLQNALEALKQEGIHKVALVVFEHNEIGNGFWERCGFRERKDVTYRNKSLSYLT